jgi:hypothetical protein
MVIGLKYGKIRADDNDAEEKTCAFVQEFSARFVRRNRSLNCTELLGCDLGTPEGRAKVTEQKLAATICEKLIKDAMEIMEEVLYSNSSLLLAK